MKRIVPGGYDKYHSIRLPVKLTPGGEKD